MIQIIFTHLRLYNSLVYRTSSQSHFKGKYDLNIKLETRLKCEAVSYKIPPKFYNREHSWSGAKLL